MSEDLLWNWYGTKVHLLDQATSTPRTAFSACGKVQVPNDTRIRNPGANKDPNDPRWRCKFCWPGQPTMVSVRRDDLWMIVHDAGRAPEHMDAWERLCDAAGNEPA